jgi:hypothetical protein
MDPRACFAIRSRSCILSLCRGSFRVTCLVPLVCPNKTYILPLPIACYFFVCLDDLASRSTLRVIVYLDICLGYVGTFLHVSAHG